MDFSVLRNQDKQEQAVLRMTSYEFVCVGDDPYTLNVFNHLSNSNRKTGFITEKKIKEDDLNLKGPSTLRGEENIKLFEEKFPSAKLSKLTPLFYKDHQFRDFSGRSKSGHLLEGESFFKSTGARVEEAEESFCLLNSSQDLSNHLNELLTLRSITSIAFEDNLVKLTCADQTQVTCEKLFWGNGLASFVDLFRDKNAIPNEVIAELEYLKGPIPVYVKFNFKKAITDNLNTLFIPLSYTYDHGHFIGEFKNLKNECQEAEFVHFIRPEEISEDEVAKRIKSLKRNLEKIFPDFAVSKEEEKITLSKKPIVTRVSDHLRGTLKTHFPWLRLVGEDSVSKESFGDYGYSRGIQSVQHSQLFFKNL